MFKKISLKNYRTHIDTTLELKDVTLIIGANNSGKSNLLSGLSYFSMLVGSARPGSEKSKMLRSSNYFSHKHSLSSSDTPISFSCEWEREGKKIDYEIHIYCLNERSRAVGCKEKITIDSKKTIAHGHSKPSQEMLLRTKLENEDLTPDEKQLTGMFFRSLAFLYYYHFQPAFLKGQAVPIIEGKVQERRNFSREFNKSRKSPNIASGIGRQGANFQELVRYVKENESITYGKFLGYLKRFVKSFNEIIIDKGMVKWQFDMGNSKFPYFDPDKISDGLVKAGAVALLCAMRTPPAVIMIEEVENGINQKNLSWIK
ncbi:AAA family ATPase [Candidatus Poribacteria bacterium]|nr:AAA family ATPase [Candidatus Poribacteria bacterium]